MNRALWATQVVLALAFLGAGLSKLAMPMDELAETSGLPGLFMRFIGLAEALGGLGLVLPGLLRIRPGLTFLAAAGLLVIMAGAVVVTIADGQPAAAPLPLAIGALLAFVLYGRWWRLASPAAAPLPLVETAFAAMPPQSLGEAYRAIWERRLDRLDEYLGELQRPRPNGATG
jgi:hypothetical protein